MRKRLLIILVVSNLLFIGALVYHFYLKEYFYDTSNRNRINCENIEKVELSKSPYYPTKTSADEMYRLLTEKDLIFKICKSIRESPAEYIDNIRGDTFLSIFCSSAKKTERFALVINHQKQVFLTKDNQTYNGEKVLEEINEIYGRDIFEKYRRQH